MFPHELTCGRFSGADGRHSFGRLKRFCEVGSSQRRYATGVYWIYWISSSFLSLPLTGLGRKHPSSPMLLLPLIVLPKCMVPSNHGPDSLKLYQETWVILPSKLFVMGYSVPRTKKITYRLACLPLSLNLFLLLSLSFYSVK